MKIVDLYIKLKSTFIVNKKLRSRYRNFSYFYLAAKNKKSKKWGVSYSVFDGEELLEHSIKSIRNSVDYVNVVYQNVSWTGNKVNPDCLKTLEILKNKGLIDELIEFEPDLKRKPGENERIKRNLGLKYAKKAKCDYFMPMDVDEFYFEDDVEIAKTKIIDDHLTHTFVNQVSYGLLPTKRSRLLSKGCFVTFFSKIDRFSKLTKNDKICCLVDPTRKLNHFFGAKYYIFNFIQMHHFNLVRKDLKKKYQNSSYPNSDLGYSMAQKVSDEKYFDVPNYWKIPDFNQ